MENTHDFVQKLQETQEKAEENQKHQGKGSPAKKLASKQHGTNK
ncbi:DUF4023 domain-containing protein [Paenibacillus eucommiae]|uniref:DUF4023 domain-containing protein n=1 Tax=Paenibacillus eucommiae TaxID=1355755 RepID=A0ABS4ITW0_9BACL|nr:DUF4023 domain-containing protein [Paenibacillus eucommiae]MBP1990014.1 hypothetical protein [Paenibacillus eucommiae]